MATALATLFVMGHGHAQTMEERARAAAEGSRAKSSDSDAIRGNYLTPGLAGQSISTVDNSRSFAPTLACRRSASLLEVMVQPSPTGDLGTVRVSRDTDLDGTLDDVGNLPVAVSGVCANGIVSCQPGSWNECRYFRWDADRNGAVALTPVEMPKLAGCYCLNNSCGANLAWTNMASVLRDLGGGMIGALTSADPRFGVAEAVIDGPMIRYVGAQSTACATSPTIPQTGYRTNPASVAADAYAASTASPVFQALKGSATGIGTALQYRHCTVERQVSVLRALPEDIIARIAGGIATVKQGSTIEYQMGSPADNSIYGGACTLVDYRMTLRVGAADRIVSARLPDLFFDDWIQLRIDGKLIASGPSDWSSSSYPAGACELKQTHYRYPDIDLKPYLTPGDHEIWMRLAVGDRGEGFARIVVELDESCKILEQVVDQCGGNAADPQCHIDAEHVDGVQTFINGVATGLKPLPQTRILGGATCPTELSRDFFLKDRVYRCALGSQPTLDLSRSAYIIDHSTETMLADRTTTSDGSVRDTTRPFALPDRGAVPACEAICKTRALKANSDAAIDGVVGAKQNVPQGYDVFYHGCDADNHCPAGPGEEIVTACGCLDDFPEATVMMQTVRLAGSDLVCTGTTR